MKRMAAVIAGLCIVACSKAPAPSLPALNLDPQRVAVVGISSGAIMAQQMHLAYSDHLLGAALLSGPPYQCAEGSLDRAIGFCMKAAGAAPDMATLATRVAERASRGELAPLSGLDGDRVLVAHGKGDVLVPESIARAAYALYEALPEVAGMNLRWDGDGDFAHLWPTLDAGVDCATTAPPYLGKCGRDFAGEVMQALFGAAASTVAPEASGTVLEFDQDRFAPSGEDAFLDATGRLYQPVQCAEGKPCGLLIAFHGCEQNLAAVGEAFVRDNGLNRWADVHSVVVLYPQTRATYLPLNPKACWDWWGYSGPDYDTRKGLQLRAVAGMAAALGVRLSD